MMSPPLTTSHLTGLLANEKDIQPTLDLLEDLSPRTYLHTLLQRRGQTISGLADEIHMSRPFVYQIFEGLRRPGRDVLLSMAIVLRLTLEEAQRLLTLFERGILYPRVRRDALLLHAVAQGFTLPMTEALLEQHGERPLLPPLRPGKEAAHAD
ncbi:MAG: helix-turn-helix domain-containing protein [Oscillospiraceae bacterium]|nr:helix-turn-helix domain-containing protein [Oscillospiraceae bacterium]